MTSPKPVRVRAGGGGADYEVHVLSGLLQSLPSLVEPLVPEGGSITIISDSNVAPLYGAPLRDRLMEAEIRCEMLVFPAGEASKNRDEWARLTDLMLQHRMGRDTLVAAVGGGVTGDLAGFVAATFLRGVPVVQVPTSLVAMIDSSVGGKTGVDVPAGKNLVGAFHPPRLVAADPAAISTLPRKERAQGLAEAVKHGAILDAGYLLWLDGAGPALLDGEGPVTERAVLRSVELKADVVSRDEREGNVRQILNFGHTIGHALEAASGFDLSHGSAVSIGMVLEARLGESLGVTETGTAEDLASVLSRMELPVSIPPGLGTGEAAERVMSFLFADKKVRAGRARFVLLDRLGRVDPVEGVSRAVPEEAVRAVLARGG
jgi:3-dehydroquinate synthase